MTKQNVNNEHPPEDEDDELNHKLGDVIGDTWAARVYVFIGAFVGLLCAVVFLIIVTPRHTAHMMIGPADRSAGTDIGVLFSENSTFAKKYQVESLGSAESTDFMRFEHILLGPSVAKAVMEENSYVEDGVKRGKRFLFADGPTVRSPEELSAYLKENVSIQPVASTPMRRLSYLHPDPEFAVNLIKLLYETADKIIKKDIKAQAIKRSIYFKKALETEENPEHREALTSLFMEQEHVLTLLAVDESFAATIIEPATTGLAPDWPPYHIVIGVFMFAGIFWNYARYFKRYRGRGKAKRTRNFDA